MDMDCDTVNPEVVMPFSAKRIEARSELEMLISHSGKVEKDSTFSTSFCACSLVINGEPLLFLNSVSSHLIGLNNIDLSEPRRGAAMTY